MECEKVRDNFANYLTARIAPSLEGEMDKHLAVCEACREEVRPLRQLWNQMSAVPCAAPDSAAMWHRFEDMLGSQTAAKPQGSWRLVLLRPAFQVSLAAMMLLGGFAIGRWRGVDPAPAAAFEMSQLRGELRDMREMLVLSLMQQQSASERLRGVSWSNQISRPDSPVLTALLDTLMHDPNVNVRLACVSALQKFGDEQIVRRGLVQALNEQESPLVQAALIDVVVALKQTESIDTLQRLMRDQSVNEQVRKLAQTALKQLS